MNKLRGNFPRERSANVVPTVAQAQEPEICHERLLASFEEREQRLRTRIRSLDAQILRAGREMRAAVKGSRTEQHYRRRTSQCIRRKRELEKRLGATLQMATRANEAEIARDEAVFVGDLASSFSKPNNQKSSTAILREVQEHMDEYREVQEDVEDVGRLLGSSTLDVQGSDEVGNFMSAADLEEELEAELRSEFEVQLHLNEDAALITDSEAQIAADLEAELESELEAELEAELQADVEARRREDLEIEEDFITAGRIPEPYHGRPLPKPRTDGLTGASRSTRRGSRQNVRRAKS